MKTFFVTLQNTLLSQVVEEHRREQEVMKDHNDAISSFSRRSARSKREISKKNRKDVMKMLGSFFVKVFVKKKVEKKNSKTGAIETVEENVPHPMYQRTHDMITQLDQLMSRDVKRDENRFSKALTINEF
jgi:hypothetical protein